MLRGLSGQRVLVLVDGIPMNSARGNGPHPSLVSTGMVDRIEVVRGPGSVLYGTSAFSGVINIVPRGRDVPDGVEVGVSAAAGRCTGSMARGAPRTMRRSWRSSSAAKPPSSERRLARADPPGPPEPSA